jgi:hypothetical protein
MDLIIMYVLYRMTGGYDEYPELELMAASEDRVKIEKKKNEIFFPSNLYHVLYDKVVLDRQNDIDNFWKQNSEAFSINEKYWMGCTSDWFTARKNRAVGYLTDNYYTLLGILESNKNINIINLGDGGMYGSDFRGVIIDKTKFVTRPPVLNTYIFPAQPNPLYWPGELEIQGVELI